MNLLKWIYFSFWNRYSAIFQVSWVLGNKVGIIWMYLMYKLSQLLDINNCNTSHRNAFYRRVSVVPRTSLKKKSNRNRRIFSVTPYHTTLLTWSQTQKLIKNILLLCFIRFKSQQMLSWLSSSQHNFSQYKQKQLSAVTAGNNRDCV